MNSIRFVCLAIGLLGMWQMIHCQHHSPCDSILQETANACAHWQLYSRDSADLRQVDSLIFESIQCDTTSSIPYVYLAQISETFDDYWEVYRYMKIADSLSMGEDLAITSYLAKVCFDLGLNGEGRLHFARYCDYIEKTYGGSAHPETMIFYATALEECQGPDVARTYMESKKSLIPDDLYDLWFEDVTDGRTMWNGYHSVESILKNNAPDPKISYSIEELDTTTRILKIEKSP